MALRRRRRLALLTFAVSLPAAAVAQGRTPPGARPTAAAAPRVSADQYVVSDGVWLRYRVVGSGPPLLMLHGYADRLDAMLPLARALGTTHRVILLDLRGFGMSGKPLEASQYGTAFVDDVVSLLDGLRIARADVIGHGVGALVAAKLTAMHPDRVTRLVLAAAPFYGDSSRIARAVAPTVAALSRSGESPPIMYASDRGAARDTVALRLVDRRALLAAAQSLPALVVRARDVTRLRVPVLAITGSRDPLADAARELSTWWPWSTSAVIDADTADGVLSDARFAARVKAFLEAR